MAYDKVIDSALLNAGMTATADAIREKTGGTDPIVWEAENGFKSAVEGILAIRDIAEATVKIICLGRPATVYHVQDGSWVMESISTPNTKILNCKVGDAVIVSSRISKPSSGTGSTNTINLTTEGGSCKTWNDNFSSGSTKYVYAWALIKVTEENVTVKVKS